IAARLGVKRRQAREHYHVLQEHTAQGVRKGQWSPAEVELLHKGVKFCGHNWTRVSSFVRTRTTNQCKMKYHYICTHGGNVEESESSGGGSMSGVHPTPRSKGVSPVKSERERRWDREYIHRERERERESSRGSEGERGRERMYYQETSAPPVYEGSVSEHSMHSEGHRQMGVGLPTPMQGVGLPTPMQGRERERSMQERSSGGSAASSISSALGGNMGLGTVPAQGYISRATGISHEAQSPETALQSATHSEIEARYGSEPTLSPPPIAPPVSATVPIAIERERGTVSMVMERERERGTEQQRERGLDESRFQHGVPTDGFLLATLLKGARMAGSLDIGSLTVVNGTPTADVIGHTIRCFVHLRTCLHAVLRPSLRYLFDCPYQQKENWGNSAVALLPLPGRTDVGIVFPAQLGTIQNAVRFAAYVQWDFPLSGWAIQ
ncbi:hypothetical protein KIPB_000069, partial [Kipferlia bialata]